MTVSTIASRIYSAQHAARSRLSGSASSMAARWPARGRTPAFDPGEVRTILVCALGALGDSLISLPAAQELRRHFPRARTVVVARSATAEAWRMSRCFDRILTYDSSEFPAGWAGLSARAHLKGDLRRERPDLGIIFWGGSAGWLRQAGCRWIVTPTGGGRVPAATHEYFFKAFTKDPRGGLTTDCWLDSLRCLGLSVDRPEPILHVPREAEIAVNRRLREHGADGDAPLFVVHPFASVTRRWWAIDEAVRLIGLLSEAIPGSRCLVVGRAAERAARVKGIAWPGGTVDLVGQLSIPELAALMDRARVVISTDSGPMHLAGVLKRPTIGLFRAIRLDQSRAYPADCFSPIYCAEPPAECGICSWDRCSTLPCRQLRAIPAEVVAREVVRILGDSHENVTV